MPKVADLWSIHKSNAPSSRRGGSGQKQAGEEGQDEEVAVTVPQSKAEAKQRKPKPSRIPSPDCVREVDEHQLEEE